MSLTFFRYFLLFHVLVGVYTSAYGQSKPSLYVNPSLWSKIDSVLSQGTPPSTYAFIPKLVTSRFRQHPDSISRNLYGIMIRLERRFNLDAAIYVGKEMARIARAHHQPAQAAAAYMELSRYYDAVGTYQLAAVNIEQALAIHKKLGNESAILSDEYARLALRLHFVSREAIIPLLETLLKKAVASDAASIIRKVHQQLLEQNLLAGKYAEAEKHIVFLERLPFSDPIKPGEYPFLINAAKGRGDLALARNNLAEAERYYLIALRLTQAEPGPWMEIHTLHNLAQLELQRGNISRAKGYLESARTKAKKLQLHDLLIQTYALKTRIAELENNPGDALRFLKQKIAHEEKFKERSEGFNIEKFYLQAERNKMTADEKNKALELNLKKSQLAYSLIILLLTALLAVGLVVGYLRQRRGKAELAHKNRLIQQHADQLQSLDDAKSHFFANISHELRTPLTLIVGPIHTLLRENLFSEKQALLLKAASRSARQLELMVKDILDLRKLEVGEMPLNLEPTHLKSFFELHLDQFQSLAQWKRIHYAHDIKIAPDLVADLDREKCRQILYNLLSNAFKFTPTAGTIEIAVEVQQGTLSFKVADTGSGIHPDDLPHVFDRFFQTSRKGQSSAGGTGIGLAICHDYTRLMNGEIRAESQPGGGSVFHVSWPITFSETQSGNFTPLFIREIDELYEVQDSTLMAGNISAGGIAAPQPTILVVEDNPGLRQYLSLVLSEKYRVIFAEHGEAAVQKIDLGIPIDLILSDLMMPVMDGYQLLEKLKSTDVTRHIPVIMLTARAEAADRLRALRIGVDDYLTKPFDEEELLVRIDNLLKNQSTRKREVLVENQVPDVLPDLPEADQVWLEKFETYIRQNLGSNILSIPALSENFAMSESTLLRQLKRLTGLTPVQYLQEIRLNEARTILEKSTPILISTLASQVGYTDARSFSRSFKKRFGKVPSDFI